MRYALVNYTVKTSWQLQNDHNINFSISTQSSRSVIKFLTRRAQEVGQRQDPIWSTSSGETWSPWSRKSTKFT